jgi:hypothetical protein
VKAAFFNQEQASQTANWCSAIKFLSHPALKLRSGLIQIGLHHNHRLIGGFPNNSICYASGSKSLEI